MWGSTTARRSSLEVETEGRSGYPRGVGPNRIRSHHYRATRRPSTEVWLDWQGSTEKQYHKSVRREGPGASTRAARRNSDQGTYTDERLLELASRNSQGHQSRLALYRRLRICGRGRLLLHHRPQEGYHYQRWRERLAGGS